MTQVGGGRDNLRASDADRERIVESLRRHTADGRLTMDEFEQRMAAAYAARTFGDLAVLTTDLPVDLGARDSRMSAAPADGIPFGFARSTDWQAQRAVLRASYRSSRLARRGTLRTVGIVAVWASWASMAVMLSGIWLISGIAGGRFSDFWPIWPIGISGLVLLARAIRGHDRGQ
jgi:hypothetical protein